MKKLNRAGKTFASVVAGATVLAVFGTGTAVAGSMITSKNIKDNTIKSKDVRNNNLKGVDVRDGSLTGADVANNSLSGADVADASLTNQDISVFFVTAEANGSVNASSGGVTIVHAGAGEYRVDFNRPVASCAFSATVGDPTSAAPVHGEADVTAQLLFSDNVRVYTRTAGSATLADLPFQVTAVC